MINYFTNLIIRSTGIATLLNCNIAVVKKVSRDEMQTNESFHIDEVHFH
jgi:hypothetical protein